MPWTEADVDRHNKGLSAKQKSVWVQVANQELASHGDDARAIRSANAAVAKMHKESNVEITLELLQEAAAKILRLDASHSALRQKLQAHVDAEHRKTLAGNGSDTGYYDTPYVHDVFGSEDGGQVVTSHKGEMHMHQFSKKADGSMMLSGKKRVRQAYVQDNDADDKKESLTLVLDGKEMEVHEAAQSFTESGVVELQEAAKTGTGKVTLISAGKGSMGYYTEAALKKAAADGIFSKGTQMFLNHQTKEERAARPEGDITKLAAVTTANAEYVEGANGQPGRLVAPFKAFDAHKGFLADAKDDIGVSVRVGATPSGKVRDGVPVVESMVYALSADFVTKAGRGGKIEEMYESYRAAHPAPAGGNQPQEKDNMTQQEQEQFAKLQAQVDRLQESNSRLMAASLLTEALAGSGLPVRGQDRVRKQVLAAIPMKDGAVDTAALQESLKAAITDEKAYLQEAGVPQPTTNRVVRGLGVVPATDKDGKELDEAAQVTEAGKVFEESVGSIFGKEKTA